jgi:glutaryl-CoA dehydrogenase
MLNSSHSDLFVIWARCKWDNKVRGFLVEAGTPGLSAPPIKNKTALRAYVVPITYPVQTCTDHGAFRSITGSIFMDSVKAGPESLLPGTKGLSSAFSCLNNARWAFPIGGTSDTHVIPQIWDILGRYGFSRILHFSDSRVCA